MIRLKGITKQFSARSGQVLALKDLDLVVNDHEFLTILGPSGCGKTTLLRIIAGLERADAGEVWIEDQLVRGPGPERAMVFQSFALMPWATVLANVTFGLEMRRVPKKKRESKARELIRLVGLKGFEGMLPPELSGGMQQRVGLARALAVEPSVLLMDEPFSALDEQTRRLLQEQLLGIWEATRTTVIFITHSMEEAVLLGDRVVLMSARPGRISEVVPVPMSRPRSTNVDSIEASQEFAQITNHLWRSLREMQQERTTVHET